MTQNTDCTSLHRGSGAPPAGLSLPALSTLFPAPVCAAASTLRPLSAPASRKRGRKRGEGRSPGCGPEPAAGRQGGGGFDRQSTGAPGQLPVGQPRGQVLVIFAVLTPVITLFFLFALGLAALHDARAHAEYALAVATRAGARHVEYGSYGSDQVHFAPGVDDRVRDVFRDALALRPAGLDGSPEHIAAELTVEVGYGSPGAPWPSPFVEGRTHGYPTVAAHALLPVRVWLFTIRVSIVSETEVR